MARYLREGAHLQWVGAVSRAKNVDGAGSVWSSSASESGDMMRGEDDMRTCLGVRTLGVGERSSNPGDGRLRRMRPMDAVSVLGSGGSSTPLDVESNELLGVRGGRLSSGLAAGMAGRNEEVDCTARDLVPFHARAAKPPCPSAQTPGAVPWRSLCEMTSKQHK